MSFDEKENNRNMSEQFWLPKLIAMISRESGRIVQRFYKLSLK